MPPAPNPAQPSPPPSPPSSSSSAAGKQVSSFDLINQSSHSKRVRRLGEFHPMLSRSQQADGQDIDDPLYGNLGGAEEEAAVARAAVVIGVSCRGLVELLKEVKEELVKGGQSGGQQQRQQDKAAAADGKAPATMASLLRQRVVAMDALDWLVPPLLQGSMEFVLD
jgi:hypothetical protein